MQQSNFLLMLISIRITLPLMGYLSSDYDVTQYNISGFWWRFGCRLSRDDQLYTLRIAVVPFWFFVKSWFITRSSSSRGLFEEESFLWPDRIVCYRMDEETLISSISILETLFHFNQEQETTTLGTVAGLVQFLFYLCSLLRWFFLKGGFNPPKGIEEECCPLPVSF